MPTTYEIHPPIGIARVGNSTDTDGFFLGPEPGVKPPQKYRDATGKLKRQAARFRIYQCERDSDGNLTKAVELTANPAAVTWTVHVINRKRASPRFVDQGIVNKDPHNRRNNATGDDTQDKALLLDPGAQSVGPNPTTKLDFTYQGRALSLGELRVEQGSGRLLVLGGFGRSESLTGQAIHGFAENDSWFDDVSDGPVSAVITLQDGTKPAVKPAWVIVAPPDFAPGIANLITLYDTLYSLAIDRGLGGKGIPVPPQKPAYLTHIFPILQRAMAYVWVNRFARRNHGPGGIADFTSTDWAGIDDPAGDADRRQDIFGLLRDPTAAAASTSFKAMPRLFSDDYPAHTTLPLTKVQYAILKKWVAGDFTKGIANPMPVEGEPDALTRTVLEACVGGAFWPGIEAGRVLRDPNLYLTGEPYRLDPAKVRSGTLTGSMALPWQADFFDCAWEVDNPDVPQRGLGWWPAQRPDDVFKSGTATNADAMVAWARAIQSPDDLVRLWHELGVVVNVGSDTNPDFRETERNLPN